MIKRRVTEGIDDEHEDRRIGQPIGFPNFVRYSAACRSLAKLGAAGRSPMCGGARLK